MKKITLLVFLSSFFILFSQSDKKSQKIRIKKEKELAKKERLKNYVNPTKKLYFGVEIGTNYIRKYNLDNNLSST